MNSLTAEPAKSTKQVELGQLEMGLGFKLRRLQMNLSRNFAVAVAGHGLRSGQFSSLAIIGANPGISQNEVSRETGLDKSATVMIVDDLESRGWAVRKRSEQDRRRHSLFITPKGQKVLNELVAEMHKAEAPAFQFLTDIEKSIFFSLLDKIVGAFDGAEQPTD